jgi:hypothetical protein
MGQTKEKSAVLERVEELVSRLSEGEKEALGVFKAIELSNALSKGHDFYELNYAEFCKALQQTVRQTMRLRQIYFSGVEYNLDSANVRELIDISSKEFFLGRNNVEGDHWSNALEISNVLLTNLKPYIRRGLLDFYSYMQGYPKVLLLEVTQSLR